jgi:hypothetical protein
MQAHELFPALGFRRGGHLPLQGFEPRNVEANGQTAKFRCLPATGGRKHRIEYLCRWCLRWIPYGRAGQHNTSPAHPDYRDTRLALKLNNHIKEALSSGTICDTQTAHYYSLLRDKSRKGV